MCAKRRNGCGEANYENAIDAKERRNVMRLVPVLFRQGKGKNTNDSDSESDDEERFYDSEDLRKQKMGHSTLFTQRRKSTRNRFHQPPL